MKAVAVQFCGQCAILVSRISPQEFCPNCGVEFNFLEHIVEGIFSERAAELLYKTIEDDDQ